MLNCIAGGHTPRAGSIIVRGVSLLDYPVEAKRMIGMSTGNCPFPYLTEWSQYLDERASAGGTLLYVAHKGGVANGFPTGRSIKVTRG